MSRTVELTTWLDAPPEAVWDHAQTSALLRHVAAPLIRFVPCGGRSSSLPHILFYLNWGARPQASWGVPLACAWEVLIHYPTW